MISNLGNATFKFDVRFCPPRRFADVDVVDDEDGDRDADVEQTKKSSSKSAKCVGSLLPNGLSGKWMMLLLTSSSSTSWFRLKKSSK